MARINQALLFLIILAAIVFQSGCQAALTESVDTQLEPIPVSSEPEQEDGMSINISSPAFIADGTIPQKYTCDAENLSPALSWAGIPQGTKSLVLIVDDPDAPVGIFDHWVLYGMAGNLNGLPEGVTKADTVSGIGMQGINDFRKIGYDGPCPPKGSTHRYYFKLYALDVALDLKTGVRKARVEQAMQGHILGQGQLMGKYSR